MNPWDFSTPAGAWVGSWSVEASEIEDEHGVPFHIFYGVSNNARKFWSITNARKVIGYEPQDDSEIRFAEDLARLLHWRQRSG